MTDTLPCTRRRTLLLLAGGAAAALSACGGGGGDGSPAPRTPTPGGPPPIRLQPLTNGGSDCFINAVLQLVVTDPRLIARLAMAGGSMGRLIVVFAAAYHAGDRAALPGAHADLLGAIRRLPGIPPAGTAGSALDVWCGDLGRSTRGLDLPLEMVDVPADISTLLAREHWAFGFQITAGTPLAPLTRTTTSYDDLPRHDVLLGLVVNTGAHYRAYMQLGPGEWWRADDTDIRRVDEAELRALVCDADHGIEIATYAA